MFYFNTLSFTQEYHLALTDRGRFIRTLSDGISTNIAGSVWISFPGSKPLFMSRFFDDYCFFFIFNCR